MPTLTWTNEIMPIKQGEPVVITLFGGFGYMVLLFVGFMLLPGWMLTQVLGCGIEKGTKEYEVDENYEMELLPKQQIALVVEKSKVDEIVELIKQELYTGHIGDGKIFVYDITNVIRVRTGDEGVDAL